MQIGSFQQNQNINFKPSFGQITPKHLFIDSPGYGEHLVWAADTVKLIDRTKLEIINGASFEKLISTVADGYKKARNSLGLKFGELRTRIEETCLVGRYEIYKNKFQEIIEKDAANVVDLDPNLLNYLAEKKEFVSKYFLASQNREVNLNKILMFREKDYLSADLKSNPFLSVEEIEYRISSPEPELIEPVYKEIGHIFKGIQKNKGKLTPENIEKITKEIAKIHWLISQTRPYIRGSAGIADVLSKSLFEAKGIQVSPYKTLVNPNLEAFVLPFDDYIKEYKNFFSEPLKPIE